MGLLFYDTETTGLPDWKKPSDDPCQPHITQIAAQLTDDEGEILGSLNVMIRPDGWTIPDELALLTGITTEKATRSGVPLPLALGLFIEMWKRCDVRVAHNQSFDARIIRIALKRAGLAADMDTWKAGNYYCTAIKSTPIVNIPPTAKMLAVGFNRPKTPNLGEAFRFFTGKDMVGAHNAAVDIRACKAVYFALRVRETESAPC